MTKKQEKTVVRIINGALGAGTVAAGLLATYFITAAAREPIMRKDTPMTMQDAQTLANIALITRYSAR